MSIITPPTVNPTAASASFVLLGERAADAVEPEGPLGNINVKLTPGRSIALDRFIFPKGALVFIQTEKPVVDSAGKIHRWQPFTRFALNQDTGGAIRGPGRADIFWGNGPYAEIAAGHLKHLGFLYFLVLKPVS